MTSVFRDKYMLDRVSFFQHTSLCGALAKLKFADADSWEALAGIMLPNVDLCKEVDHVSPIAWAFLMVDQSNSSSAKKLFDGLFHDSLFGRIFRYDSENA